jgi:hypothetical protein
VPGALVVFWEDDVPILAVLCLGLLAVVALGAVASAVHERAARAAIDPARGEDVPQLLASSGRTLTGLVAALHRVVPADAPAPPGESERAPSAKKPEREEAR